MTHFVNDTGTAPHPKGRVEQECRVLAEKATECLLDYLYLDEYAFIKDSAMFLQELDILWQRHGVDSGAVWQELNARIDLSADLLQRGIRARKGGRYRSTKLP